MAAAHRCWIFCVFRLLPLTFHSYASQDHYVPLATDLALERPYAAELSDFASLIILILGVAVLQQADISFIYHYIRGQATINLYVVFNVLEIFDKLCQSFGGDVLQILLNSAMAIGDCPPERLLKQWAQFCKDYTKKMQQQIQWHPIDYL